MASHATHATTSTGAARVKRRLWLAAPARSRWASEWTARSEPQNGQSSPVIAFKGHSGTWVVLGSPTASTTVAAATTAPVDAGRTHAGRAARAAAGAGGGGARLGTAPA